MGRLQANERASPARFWDGAHARPAFFHSDSASGNRPFKNGVFQAGTGSTNVVVSSEPLGRRPADQGRCWRASGAPTDAPSRRSRFPALGDLPHRHKLLLVLIANLSDNPNRPLPRLRRIGPRRTGMAPTLPGLEPPAIPGRFTSPAETPRPAAETLLRDNLKSGFTSRTIIFWEIVSLTGGLLVSLLPHLVLAIVQTLH